MMYRHLGACRAPRGNIAMMLTAIVAFAILGQSNASSSLRASQLAAVDDTAIPQSGDLVHEVKEQLASDHSALGKVSAVLMSVQSSVDQTEQSMLGKVLDLQTARTFFTRHEVIETANDKMEADVSGLNTQVEGLSSSLSKVTRQFLAAASENTGSEGKLRSESIEDKALIEAINAELAKGNDVQESLRKLTKIHDDLLAEAVEALNAGRKSVKMLSAQRTTNHIEVAKHRSLRDQLIKMNNYSVACHGSVEKKSKKLGQMLVKDSKDNKASSMTLTQKKKANDATQQRLLAERALLVSEVKRLEKEGLDEVERLKDLREDLVTLQGSIVSEVRKTQTKINGEAERVQGMKTALMANTEAEAQDLSSKEEVERMIRELMKQTHDMENPIIIATTQGQNDALQAELNEAYVLFEAVKKSETAAALNLDQAESEVEAQKLSVSLADQSLTDARNEGEKRVEEAVKAARASTDKSLALIDKAKAFVAGKCEPKWTVIRKRQKKKLRKCRANKAELLVQTATKDSLMQTLKAQEAPAF